ncbi:MAG: hypothetical protein C0601_03385 [Candidatus Muiribacterium halophilum]|uniref:Uncharacterized protein n=1 Tax=Muiribacterium halophilum TaxID=2053465 RepID=A0A2N5ZJN6_MUIH1|nr:MAG: hypothetical protein C0601_03385 [Candidatus Muirbacterium halophilum]
MKEVRISFNGNDEKVKKAAQAIYTYIVDGGGEDVLLDILDMEDIEGEMSFDNETGNIIFKVK